MNAGNRGDRAHQAVRGTTGPEAVVNGISLHVERFTCLNKAKIDNNIKFMGTLRNSSFNLKRFRMNIRFTKRKSNDRTSFNFGQGVGYKDWIRGEHERS